MTDRNRMVKVDMRRIEQLSHAYPAASKAARQAKVQEAVVLLEAAVKKDAPYGAGPIHLRDTIFGQVYTFGEKVSGIVGTPVAWAEPLEYGADPHFPPLEPITWWVEKVIGEMDPKQARNIAYAICLKIAKEGTEGKFFFRDALEGNQDMIMRILEEIPSDILRRAGGGKK